MKTILLILFLTFTSYSQDLPDRGTIADIASQTNLYLIADGDYRKAVTKAIGKNMTIVDKAKDAQFFVEYRTLSRTIMGPTQMSLETGQMDVYILRDKQKVIAWSDSLTAGGFGGDTAKQLTKRFLKARKATK